MRFWDFIRDLREGAAREGGGTCYAAKCPVFPMTARTGPGFSCSLSEYLTEPFIPLSLPPIQNE